MTRSYPVWVIVPQIVRVGSIALPAALVDAFPQILVAAKLREGSAGAPDSVLLTRAHVRHDVDYATRGLVSERGLVVAPGKDLEILTRLDEFTLGTDLLTLEAIQASVH